MAYLALARKYRPQTFDQLVAQEFVVKTLQNAMELNRISHAYLFTGPRGVGKTSVARIFAKALNCLNPKGVNPCNECENCLEITSGTSVDVVEIDGASNRGIEDIRELREAVKFIPMKCTYKVYIIDEVHMLTDQAFNALLKTLEEPPDFAIFVLATTDAHKIPATILSRCQRYDFKKIPFGAMYECLVEVLGSEKVTFEDDALNLVIRNSDGCMRDALSLLDQVIAFTDGSIDYQNTAYLLGYSDKSLMNELFEAVLDERVDAIAPLVDAVNEKGVSYKFVIETFIEHTRNLLFASAMRNVSSKEFTAEEVKFYSDLMNKVAEPRLFALFQLFQKALTDMKFFSFERYVFEFALYKAASLSKVIPVEGAVKAAPAPQAAPSAPVAPKVDPRLRTPAPERPAAKPEFQRPAPRPEPQRQEQAPRPAPQQQEPKRSMSTTDLAAAFENAPASKPAEPEPGQKTEHSFVSTTPEMPGGPKLTSTDKLWEQIADAVGKENPALAANMLHGNIVNRTENRMVVGFDPVRRFNYTLVVRDDNRTILEKYVARFLPGLKLELVVLSESEEGKKKALVEKTQEIESYYDRTVREKAREHEIVRGLVDAFDGRIEKIDVYKKRSEKQSEE